MHFCLGEKGIWVGYEVKLQAFKIVPKKYSKMDI